MLLAAIPGSLALALDRIRHVSLWKVAVTLSVLLLSVWVAISVAAFDMKTLAIGQEDSYRYEAFCWYLPEFSVLWHADTNWSTYLLPTLYGALVAVVLGYSGLARLARAATERCAATLHAAREIRA